MDEHIKKVADELDFTPLKNIKNNIYLNQSEISILSSYQIDFENCQNIEELICKIDMTLDEYEDAFDLEDISQVISERNYYMNTKK